MKFKNMVRCDSPEVVKELVRLRAGVGFLYYDSIGRGIERGDFKVIRISGLELSGQNYIIYRKDKALNSLAKEFLSLLRRSVTKDLRPDTGSPQANRSPAAQRPLQIVRSTLGLWIAMEVLLFA
jgi:hypothetical protein